MSLTVGASAMRRPCPVGRLSCVLADEDLTGGLRRSQHEPSLPTTPVRTLPTAT